MNPAFEDRRQHAFNKIEWHIPAKKRAGKLLDIGCGIGNGIVAAVQQGFKTAVGIDRDLGEFGWHDPAHFNAICHHYGISAGQAVLIEGDIFQTKFAPGSFDCVLMLDSIEHVPDPRAFIEYGASCLVDGGTFVLDTCPLYYSRAGGHLFNHFDPDIYPWVHLRHDFREMVEQRGVDKWSLDRFHELNKVTHDQIRLYFEGAGLSIYQEVRGDHDPQIAYLLERDRHLLNLDGIDERWLFENWIMLAATKN